MPNHAKNPPTVLRLTNQLNTVFAPLLIVKNANHGNTLLASTAAIGSPALVHRANTRGACPRSASPYRMRLAVNRNEFPAENALVKTHALTTCGSPRIPARLMAIT